MNLLSHIKIFACSSGLIKASEEPDSPHYITFDIVCELVGENIKSFFDCALRLSSSAEDVRFQ